MVQKALKPKARKPQSMSTQARKSTKLHRPVPRKPRNDVGKIRLQLEKTSTKSMTTLVEQKAANKLTNALGINNLKIVKTPNSVRAGGKKTNKKR